VTNVFIYSKTHILTKITNYQYFFKRTAKKVWRQSLILFYVVVRADMDNLTQMQI